LTTFLTVQAVETQAQETTPGCGCCIPPPDTVDKRMAQLEERRERLEARLRRLRS
jgi:hypothetical protein